MKSYYIIIVLSLVLTDVVNSKTTTVSTNQQLVDALSAADAGDTIHLKDGTYKGNFIATKNGKDGSRITLNGTRSAVLVGYSAGFSLEANYWTLSGFTVANTNKGIIVDGGNHNILEDLEVHNITQEGVHFRYNSADNILRNSYIHHTGQGTTTDQGYGEGVYIGEAVNNWKNGPDKSDRNHILNNQIGPDVAAECIDIKEGSCCGLIQGNNFIGPEKGQNYAMAWMDIKGDNYTIEDNTGSKPLLNGFELHQIAEAKMGGCNNIIKNNHCSGIPKGGQCVDNGSKCENSVSNNETG